jgi:hypothetical protein
MMLLPSLPLLLPNYCRCSRLRAQGVTDRQHITALIRLCNAFAIPLRRHHTALQHAREASAMPLRTRLQLLSD